VDLEVVEMIEEVEVVQVDIEHQLKQYHLEQ
jgi:hypothetical protein